MRNIRLAIGVPDASYCKRLLSFLSGRRDAHTEIQVFSERTAFWRAETEDPFDAALLSEEFFGEGASEPAATRFVLFNDGELPASCRAMPTIFRFQSVDGILRELFSFVSESGTEDTIFTGGKELIGIYSPHGHSLQTAFALALAERLSRSRRVLYLNFTDCAGFSEQLDTEYDADIGDLLYYTRAGGERFYGKLRSMLYQIGEVDYVPPAANPELLHEAGREDYERLLRALCERTDHEVLILDFGTMVSGFFELLNRCDKIYCLTDESGSNDYRRQQFAKYLTTGAEEALAGRVKYLTLREQSGRAGTVTELKDQIFSGESGETLLSALSETEESYGD